MICLCFKIKNINNVLHRLRTEGIIDQLPTFVSEQFFFYFGFPKIKYNTDISRYNRSALLTVKMHNTIKYIIYYIIPALYYRHLLRYPF